jgi:pyruvate/2-oxoglutarate dehydrogenase complex dihydrolipoamide dehydrogenase (E3) component
MADYDYDIGVLGGGSAGLTVTAGAAQLGAKAILIEKEKVLGGDCLHFGCVPSKTLIRTAAVYHQMKNAREFGLPEVDLKPVDFRDVAARIQSVIGTIQKHDSEERFCGLGAKVEFGAAEFVDEHSVRVNGKTVSAKNWVISTGSSAAVPPIEGLENTPYITNREIFSLDRLPPSMIVLGGGPIGIEMAQAFARLGTEVTVVQRGAQILSKEDRDMAELVMGVLKSEGISFYLGTQVLRTEDRGTARHVVIRQGEETRTLTADTILVALGRAPNVTGLGLDRAGVLHSERGVPVDRRLRTNHPHIYAAGDTTGQYIFTHAAGYDTNMPWCTYTDPELASIGMNEQRAKEAGIEYTVWTEEFASNDRSLAEGERVGKVKMLLDEREKPLGVQILGPHAGELIGEWVAAINGKVKLSTLAAAVHPYPTLGEINKKVAGDLLATKIFSDTVKKGLKFFFHLKGRACSVEESGS